jgi:hypothetical protein
MKEIMLKSFLFVAFLTACGASLWAQSTADATGSRATVTLTVTPLDSELAKSVPDVTDASTPFLLNIFTLIGVNSTGLPCYNCVTSVAAPNLGILTPSGYIVKGGAASQINVYLYDFNYTGSCTFTIQIVDKTKTVVVSTNPTFSFTAPTNILLGTALPIPSTAAVGVGYVETIAVCGASTTKSASAFYIAQ